ncbi:MAG: HAMP domain-containing histidine kinase, partial [Desulfobacteraceae bacterium]|nr:HAMP domain-containing histidine kinase [Desulfobacteraceae bacterium]
DYYNKYKELKTAFEKEMDLLAGMLTDTEGKRLAQEARVLFQNYSLLFAKEAQVIKNPPKDYDPSVSLAERNGLAKDVGEKLKHIIVVKSEIKNSRLLLSSLMIGKAIQLTIIITIVAIVLGVLLSVLNTRAITNSIFLLEKKTREIAKGQFTQIPSNPAAPKEIDDLTQHFNVMCTRLKELEVMKTDFISHFSHELRTPVTSIKEAGSMLNMKLFSSDPQKEKELSVLILTECDRLIKSIERILDLSKMEVFKMEWEFSKSEIIKVIQNALNKFIPAAQNKKIQMTLIPPQKGVPKIKLDEKRIEEVINNLISNALKYTPEKGIITIKTEPDKNKKKIKVSVSDNGCGIDKQNLDRIFEKFKRIDNGNDTLRGTGLGLAISKHIIKAHKGEIWAESELSKGTKISFILPVV